MRILFLSTWYPYPPDNGSKLRVYNLLRGLAQSHQVTLISFTDEPPANSPPALEALCTAVYAIPRRAYRPARPLALLSLLSPTPRVIVDTYTPAMARQIERALQAQDFHLVVASQWSTAAYCQTFLGMPAVFEEIEVGVFQSKISQATSPARRFRHRLTLLKLQFYLRRLLPHFRMCTVASATEATLLRRLVPACHSVEIIPNCVSLADYGDMGVKPQPNSLVFAGSLSYAANHDAMIWFLGQVYPRIRASLPAVRLTITGDHASQPLPSADNLTMTGLVDDVRPLVTASWVSLAPIRLGGGTRLKILEAMALRTPVVATSKGAEGLEVQHDEHLLIADTPEAFAEAVIRLLRESGLRQRLADNAYELVRRKYDWRMVLPRFLQLIERVAPA